jgi:hypothetical protein
MSKESRKTVNLNAELIIAILALIASVVSVFLSTYYSYLGIKTNVRPTLVFVYNPSSGWALRNVGSGPALNALVAYKETSNSEWQTPVRLYPLKSDDEVPVSWFGLNPKVLAVAYQDANNTAYTSICDNDLTTTYEGNRLPIWDEKDIKKTWELPLSAPRNSSASPAPR